MRILLGEFLARFIEQVEVPAATVSNIDEDMILPNSESFIGRETQECLEFLRGEGDIASNEESESCR